MVSDRSEAHEPDAELSQDELVAKFLERPCTLAGDMCVTVRGFAAEAEAVAQKLGRAVVTYFQILSRFMDLSRVERVIVAADYTAALAEVDRGIETKNILVATKDELMTGVAMTPAVLRDGVLRCQVLLDANFVIAMLERDSLPIAVSDDEFKEMGEQAHYLIAHEAGHAHDQAVIDRQLPGWILREPLRHYESGAALTSLSEYTACRLSATFGGGRETKNYEETFAKALATTREEGNRIIIAYRTHADLSSFVNEFIPLYTRLVKAYSYLLGHLDGLGQRIEDAAPTAYQAVQNTAWFTDLAKRWHEALQQGWEIYGTWKSPEEMYMPLQRVFHDVLRKGGIDVQPRPDGQFYIDIPFTVETLPG